MAQAAAKLKEGQGTGEPLIIRLSRIERYEQQPRRFFSKTGLEELAEDLHEKGQHQPVRVCKHPKKPGVFVLIGGERRWRAFHLIQERTGKEPLVKAFVDSVSPDKHFEEALYDNLQREDLVPLDEAASYKRLYDAATEDSKSAKIATIARKVKKSASHVANYLLIDSLPFKVQRLMDQERPKDQQLSITAAIDIAKSTKDDELRFSIAKEAIDRNLGIDETRMLISVRTGASGWGVGGSSRKPAEDYRTYRTFLQNTLSRMRRIEHNFVLDDLYAEREDEDDDRKADAETLELVIKGLQKMLKEVKAQTVGA